ncbi:tRNA 2-selenouridine(34) synthase MnmH [Paenibacillus sp. HN-1]|uniref:tRNA 2-selenouridine(34) synthase MnmH n=1 Tax=Paenibacillus TaxID=44249 RepID=UPI001CA933D8|nr:MULTISPECIES: tRNA 2-selenouridine(34) synthase MnmH [Paenibacillus]MBY9079298.1 tRNA 2-selenouridine(34) synthase MnmH [Paenibacillus sp. CGMCC 1.18879]MBY9087021.1 tRNA 2-selenouridine(34) synthase MnmH [Paenibacillus sinensis]
MFQDISLEELRALQEKKQITVIDVRSPSEFKNSTLPSSLNIPLFDDAERAEVGTLYTQTSVQAAKERGLQIVSAKLPAFIHRFGEIPGSKAVFCWRGGMRSRTTATLLSLMDIHVYRLQGGYKAYRKWVTDSLESYEFRPHSCIIHGNTGTGKTALLNRLEQKGYPALDLEGMAGHRGSIFGQVGLSANNQKTFDSLLLEKLLTLESSPYVLYEAESMRIGKVVMPAFMGQQKETGTQLWIEMPIEARVKQIMEDYQPQEHQEELQAAFQRIKSRIHVPVAAEIDRSLSSGEFHQAVLLLLEYYYDPKYSYTSNQYGASEKVAFTVRNLDEAEAAVTSWLRERFPQAGEN